VSGRHSYKKLREKMERDPERRERMEGKRKAYDAVLNLAELREAKGLTQAELAARLGVSQPNVSKLEAAAASRTPAPSTPRPSAGTSPPWAATLKCGPSSPKIPRTTSLSPSAGDGLGSLTPGIGTTEISERSYLFSFFSGFRTAQPETLRPSRSRQTRKSWLH